jgi:Cdc6-like AAA superfamily ATPase
MVKFVLNLHAGSELPKDIEIHINLDNHSGQSEYDKVVSVNSENVTATCAVEKPVSAEVADIKQYIKKFDIEKHFDTANGGKSILIYGRSGSGKTAFARSIVEVCKTKSKSSPYVIAGRNEAAGWEELDCTVEDTRDEKQCIATLKNISDIAEKHPECGPIISILDDFPIDHKCWNNSVMLNAVYNGRANKRIQLFLTQSFKSAPKAIRNNMSYIAILGYQYMSIHEKRMLWNELGSIFQTFEKFDDCIREIFKHHRVVVFDQRIVSNSIEDCVFHF